MAKKSGLRNDNMNETFEINFNDKVYVFLTEQGKERFKNQYFLKNIKDNEKIELTLKELSYNLGHMFFCGATEAIKDNRIYCNKYPNSCISLNAIAIVKLTGKGKDALKENYKQYDVGGGYVDKLIESLTKDVTRTELHDILFTFSDVAMNQDILFDKESIKVEEFFF